MRVFISAVSSEFEQARDQLANSLQGGLVEVRLQRSFRHEAGAETLLQLLHDYIRGCDRTIALIGSRSGTFPPEAAVTPDYRALLPDGMTRASYTQWEVIFARHYHPGHVFLHRPDTTYTPDRDTPPDDDPDAQAAFDNWLDNCGIHWRPFGSADALRANVLEIGWPDEAAPRPRKLPFQSLGNRFKGRAEDLDRLHQIFSRGHNAVITSTAMHGLGGVGKTRAAVEYALAHEDEFSAILFLTAKSPTELATEVAGLVAPDVLNLPEQDEPSQDIRHAAAIRWLQSHPGWLLILDNVDSEDAAQAVEALLGRLSGGRVLITTRVAHWSPQVTTLPMELLSREAAVALLLDATPKRRPEPDAEAQADLLADDLGDLALALTQAAAYIDTGGRTFAAYRTEWERNRKRLIGWHNARIMQYPLPVAATWLTSFEQLSDDARTLLEMLAFLSVEPIPECLLDADYPVADFNRRDALAELTGLSLATQLPGVPTFTIHRLVQEVARDRMDEATSRDRLAAMLDLLVDALPVAFSDFDITHWTDMLPWEPHALRLVDLAGDGTDKTLGELLKELALICLGKPRALSWHSIQNSPELACLLTALASMHEGMARFVEAESFYRRALAIWQARVGPKDFMVAMSLDNLALFLANTGRDTEAEPLLRRAHAIREAKLGPENPEVALSRNQLASFLLSTGRAGEAEPMLRRALAILEVAWPEGTQVATGLNDLARILMNSGREEEAEPMFRRALAIREAYLGPEDPELAASLNNLACLLKNTGREEEAEPMFRRSLLILLRIEKSTDHRHPHGSTAIANYRRNLARLGRSPEDIARAISAVFDEAGLPLPMEGNDG